MENKAVPKTGPNAENLSENFMSNSAKVHTWQRLNEERELGRNLAGSGNIALGTRKIYC